MTELLNGRRGGSKARDLDDDRHDGLATSFVQSDIHRVRCNNCWRMGHYVKDCSLACITQGDGRLFNIDGNAHANAFQLSDVVDDESQSSYNSRQDRANEWNSYYF